MSNVFDYVKTINEKTDQLDIDGYVPFIVNKAFSFTLDTIFYANMMNINSHIDAKMQYDFYYHALPKKKRFGKWIKKDTPDIASIREYYNCSIQKAIEYSKILTIEQVAILKQRMDKGGRK